MPQKLFFMAAVLALAGTAPAQVPDGSSHDKGICTSGCNTPNPSPSVKPDRPTTPTGPSPAEQEAARDRVQALALKAEGVADYEAGDYEDAEFHFATALLKLPGDADISEKLENVRNKIAEEKKRKDAAADTADGLKRAQQTIRDFGNKLSSSGGGAVSGMQFGSPSFDGPPSSSMSDGSAAGTSGSGYGGMTFGTPGGSAPVTPAKPSGCGSELQFGDPNVVNLCDAKTLTVDPAKVSGISVPKPQPAPVAAPRTPVVTEREMQQIFNDPQYQANYLKHLLAVGKGDKAAEAEAQQFEIRWSQQTVLAIEKGRVKELLDLRRASYEMSLAYDKIQRREQTALLNAETHKRVTAQAEMIKIGRPEGLNGVGAVLMSKDPRIRKLLDGMIDRLVADEERAVNNAEAQARADLLEAGHRIISLGKPWPASSK